MRNMSKSDIESIVVCKRSGAFVRINERMVYCPQKLIQALFQANEDTLIIIGTETWTRHEQASQMLIVAYIGVPRSIPTPF